MRATTHYELDNDNNDELDLLDDLRKIEGFAGFEPSLERGTDTNERRALDRLVQRTAGRYSLAVSRNNLVALVAALNRLGERLAEQANEAPAVADLRREQATLACATAVSLEYAFITTDKAQAATPADAS